MMAERGVVVDHGALKCVINPTRCFKTLPTASATLKGFEVMRMIRKGHCLMLESGVAGEVRFVNRLFRLAAWMDRGKLGNLWPWAANAAEPVKLL